MEHTEIKWHDTWRWDEASEVRHDFAWDDCGWHSEIWHVLTDAAAIVSEFNNLIMITLDELAIVTWQEITTLAEVDSTLELLGLSCFKAVLMMMSDISILAICVPFNS